MMIHDASLSRKIGDCPGCRRETKASSSKACFFEKKKQKTLVVLASASPDGLSAERDEVRLEKSRHDG
jgi:hypothetical protein